MKPQIRYARTSDGVDIAYAAVGSGPPLLVLRQFISPDVAAEVGEEPRWRAPWLDLAGHRTMVIWDYRGTGLSGPADRYTLESGVLDMQAVVDETGAGSFDVMAAMSPCHVAIAYAAGHPEHVNRMALLNPGQPGGSMRFSSSDLPDIAATHFRDYADLFALRAFGWDRAERARRLADFIATHYTGETWARLNKSIEAIDATPLAASVTSPTLILIDLNAGNPQLVRPDRQLYMRRLAAAIPGAEMTIVQKGDPRAYVDLVDAFLTSGAPPAEAATPSGTAIILFADIAGSTALTERMGDAAFRERSRALDAEIREAVREAGGTPVEGKVMGDGVMSTFASAREAIDAALRCRSVAEAAGMLLHLGMHAGDVIREENNVYGGAVNIAARVCDASAPGEILVSEIVRGLARTSAGVTFEDRGEHALKGVADAVRVFAVRRG